MIRQWLADYRANRAALFLAKCRVRRERQAHQRALEVARQMRRDMGLPDLPGLMG